MKKKNRILHILAVMFSALFLCSCTNIENHTIDMGNSEETAQTEHIEIALPIDTQKEEITAAAITTEAVTEEPQVVKENIDYKAFEKKIAELKEKNSVIGMGLCVFADGKVIYQTNSGYADKENEILCDENTHYRVASVSKLISTMTLMTLYDEGKIDPYSRLQELTGIHFNHTDEDVLLWHLATHTAGFWDGDMYKEAPKEYYTVSEVLENCNMKTKPGTNYCYTNLGMGSVGSIVEVLTGEFFHDYAYNAVFSKLDMDAAYCVDMLKDRSQCANLYKNGELEMQPKLWGRTTGYYESFGLGNSYLTAQCELLITPKDLARLGIIISGDGSVDGVNILSQEAVDVINTEYYSDESIPFDVGLSTRIYRGNFIEDRTIYGHSGAAYGNVCGLYYDPTDGTGIAICTNGCGLGADMENGIFNVIEDCTKAVYDTFFVN